MVLFNSCYSKAIWYYVLSPTILFTHKSWNHTWGKTFNEDPDIHHDGVYLQVDTTVKYYPNMTLCHDPMLRVPLNYVCRVGNYVTRSERKDLQVTRFGSRVRARARARVCVCVRLPGPATQLFHFMTTWHQLTKTENGAHHEAVHRFHQGAIYCQNVIRASM